MAWLAHYGVPKSQWSDEARRRYDAQHRGGKTLPWGLAIRNLKTVYDAYQEEYNNRGGNRSNNIHNKVDESRVNARRSRDNGDSARFDRAQSSRRHTNGTGVRKPASNGRTPLRDTSIRSKNPGTEEVRRRDLNETQRSLRNGKNSSRRSKNTPTTQAADTAISRNMRSGKNSSNGAKSQNPYLISRVAQQVNRAQENINGRRRLSELGRNGQLVKQNRDMNAFLTTNGLNANSLRINPKGYGSSVRRGSISEGDGRSHLKTNKRKKSKTVHSGGGARRRNGNTWRTGDHIGNRPARRNQGG